MRKNREARNEYMRTYYKTHPREWKDRYQKNKERLIGRAKELLEQRKDEAYKLLGNKCTICGFTDRRALQVDHVNGDGKKDRKGIAIIQFYLKVIESVRRGERKYQLLCANHNWIKRVENHECK